VNEQPAISLVDGLGHTVTLAAPAQRILSLAPSNTEILFALGAGGQMVGRDKYSDFPVEAKALPDVGGVKDFNLEAVVRLQPDLVLMAGINSPDLVESLQQVGLTVFYLNNPTDLDGMYTNLQTVARLCGREKEAQTLVADLRARSERVVQVVQKAGSRPKVFYELDGTDPVKPWTAGPGSFVDYLIRLAGGENVAGGLKSEWGQLSQEELLLQDPDVIVLGDHNFGMTAEQVKARPGWAGLKAVKENRALPFDDNLAARPGPRLVQGLEELARMFHPELADQLK